MKETKAQALLPEELILALQEYIEGETIYIPKRKERRKWGVQTGNREYYHRRNQQIRHAFKKGTTIHQLATDYYLSMETIKKIVYKRN
ncbi:CD3324 family protein [Gracilibacillus sp. D59]|uniref:CD3324 family protein n=1 Tax=Gracilibacillus sp. D59 TaxID=3457434 RepID=UPI003FCC403A